MMRKTTLAPVMIIVAVAWLLGISSLRATPFYPTTGSIGISETGLTVTPNSGGSLFHTTLLAANIGTVTLYNIFEFTRDVTTNNLAATLTGVGKYTAPGSLEADATNASIYIDAAESDYNFDAASAGSATSPQIPGFSIAASLAPGQTVTFTEDFEVSPGVTSLLYNFVNSATTVPEPSAFVSIGMGMITMVGVARKRGVPARERS